QVPGRGPQLLGRPRQVAGGGLGGAAPGRAVDGVGHAVEAPAHPVQDVDGGLHLGRVGPGLVGDADPHPLVSTSARASAEGPPASSSAGGPPRRTARSPALTDPMVSTRSALRTLSTGVRAGRALTAAL